MVYDPERRHRRSIRLKGYDYSGEGAYFLTICVQGHACLFGDISDGHMVLNDAGWAAAESWEWLAAQYDYVELDQWVIMPNHMHGVIVVTGRGGSRTAPTSGIKQKPLGRLIGAFKTVSAKRINELRNTPGAPVWQRNYYEHIIRNERSLNRIREYIVNNPMQWEMDRENPVGARRNVPREKDESWRI
jgi:putative transposase